MQIQYKGKPLNGKEVSNIGANTADLNDERHSTEDRTVPRPPPSGEGLGLSEAHHDRCSSDIRLKTYLVSSSVGCQGTIAQILDKRVQS